MRTPVDQLKEIHRKEELESRFALHPNINETLKDHLPFGSLISMIAGTMKNAPPKPSFKIKLDKE